MGTFEKKLLLLCSLAVSSLAFAKVCESELMSSSTQMKKEIESISRSFFIPKRHAVGFSIKDKITLTQGESIRLYKLIKKAEVTHEQMLDLFKDIAITFETYKPDDIIRILEYSIENDMHPGQLSAALSMLREKLRLVNQKIGFSVKPSSYEFSEANLQELLVIFKMMEKRKGLDESTFYAEVTLIANAFHGIKALEILSIMGVSHGFDEELSVTVEHLQQIQNDFVIEKRRIGFVSVEVERHSPSARMALTLLLLMRKHSLDSDALIEEFETFKVFEENPKFVVFLKATSERIREQAASL